MNAESSTDPRWGLPRGATGFWDRGSTALPMTDSRAFERVCYEVARQLDGRVQKITAPTITPNFYIATITRGDRRLALLGHLHLPLLALAAAPVDAGAVRFIDDPVSRTLTSLGSFRLLSLSELSTPLALADLSGLAKAELKQITLWKPHSVGELLFNYWD